MKANINIQIVVKDLSPENVRATVQGIVVLRDELEANGFNEPSISVPRASTIADEKGPQELAYLAASGKQRMKVMDPAMSREDWATHLLAQMNGTSAALHAAPIAPPVNTGTIDAAPVVEYTEADLA